MKKWYGWIIEQSFNNQSVFERFSTVKMKFEDKDWKEHIVEIPEDNLNKIINFLKKNLKQSWYAHLVKGNDLIVVFKNKSFKFTNKSSFLEVSKYGRKMGIPEEQLPNVSLFDLARKSGY